MKIPKYLLFLLPAIGGIFLSLGWPSSSWTVFLFIAFIPFLLSEYFLRNQTKSSLKVFLTSYFGFLVWNLLTTFWIRHASFGGALVAVLINSLLMALVFVMYSWFSKIYDTKKGLWFFICLWICFEKFHMYWGLNWPWLNLGNGLAVHHQLIQWYEYTGTFGGSLWILLANSLLFYAILRFIQEKNISKIKFTTFLAVVVLVVPIIISLIIYNSYEESHENINVLAYQPNIDAYKQGERNDNINLVRDLRNEVLKHKIDSSQNVLIVAPETAIQRGGEINKLKNKTFFKGLKAIASDFNADILIGTSLNQLYYHEDKAPMDVNYSSEGKVWYKLYNSGLFISKDLIDFHHKSKFVPGVESFPFKSILQPIIGRGFINSLPGNSGSLTPDSEFNVLTNSQETYKLTPAICYESIFGEYVASFTAKGSNLIAIITNDGWWENTEGHRQHFLYAKLRAIENRKSIIRAANTGISALINEKGDILSQIDYEKHGSIFGEVSINDKKTIYSIYGDYIFRLSFFIGIILLLRAFVYKIRGNQ